MDIKKINTIYFSPNGSTKKIANIVAKGIGELDFEEIDLTFVGSIGNNRRFTSDELVVIGMPVYSDRLPSISDEILKKIKGYNTPAVVLVSYGNRGYGDALLELKDKVEARGFKVISGAAIVGEHCLNTNIASGRPDKEDKIKILDYAKNISKKIMEIEELGKIGNLKVKGEYPYAPLKSSSTPSGDSKCIQCGKCEENCPVEAISKVDFSKTDSDTCIFCGKCIQVCPENARDMKKESFLSFMEKLETIAGERREIEMFL